MNFFPVDGANFVSDGLGSNSFSYLLQMKFVDGLPRARPSVEEWLKLFSADGGNATLITLCVCLLTVLYLRQRQRRMHYGRISS